MTNEEKAAFIISQAVCAMAEIEAMKVENTIAALRNEYPLRNADDFQNIIRMHGLDHNTVIAYINNY
jgi:hypothetical protein